MIKPVTVELNGNKYYYDSCIEAAIALKEKGFKIHSSAIGKVCNGHLKQYVGCTLEWTDPASKTTHHGRCREVTCITNGDETYSMQGMALLYETNVKAIKRACEEHIPIKCKGGFVSFRYTRELGHCTSDLTSQIRKLTAELERLRKANEPTKVKVTVRRIRREVR